MNQHVFNPAGPQSAEIAALWWIFVVVCGIVFVALLVALLIALMRAPRGDERTPPDLSALERPNPVAFRAVAAATAVSIAGLVALSVASLLTDRALARLPADDPMRVELTANQWWWDVRYDDALPSRIFTTANELHLPVGRTITITLRSNDVIHSFWVPNLHGKKDMIPGRTTTIRLRVDREGVYRGQCAEFCGFQHARMALLVVAQTPEAYDAWAERQRAPAAEPPDALAARGRAVFEAGSCPLCHRVQGTSANGRQAPDLTHVGSRRTLAAGTLPNTPGHLAGWIVDPQRIKPGVNMPANALPPEDLRALLAYLGALK